MRNRNMPSNAKLTHERCGDVTQSKTSGGLTKLEYASIAAMQGLLTDDLAYEQLAQLAVEQANALFDELEKDNEQGKRNNIQQ